MLTFFPRSFRPATHSASSSKPRPLPHYFHFTVLTRLYIDCYRCVVRYKANGKVPLHPKKTYKGSRSIAPLICNLGVVWRSVVKIMQQPLYLQEITAGTHRIRRRVGTRARMDVLKKRKISFPRPEFEPRTIQPAA
jgi:hypothetical protein